MTGIAHFPTANGSGVAIFDYDSDGKIDLYFATCTLLRSARSRKGPIGSTGISATAISRTSTEASGLGFAGFCHGVVVGDIDNDGDQDVFLCNYGANVLYLNNGDGTFRDMSKEAGVDRPGWSSGGAFLDYDNDGDLDLYVSNYGHWEIPVDDQFCRANLAEKPKSERYCSPRSIKPARTSFTGITETGPSPT